MPWSSLCIGDPIELDVCGLRVGHEFVEVRPGTLGFAKVQLPLIPTAHDLINCTGMLDSQLARHGKIISGMENEAKSRNRMFLRSDPNGA